MNIKSYKMREGDKTQLLSALVWLGFVLIFTSDNLTLQTRVCNSTLAPRKLDFDSAPNTHIKVTYCCQREVRQENDAIKRAHRFVNFQTEYSPTNMFETSIIHLVLKC